MKKERQTGERESVGISRHSCQGLRRVLRQGRDTRDGNCAEMSRSLDADRGVAALCQLEQFGGDVVM